MRPLLLLLLSFTLSFGTTVAQLIQMYKEKNYYDVCSKGVKLFNRLKRDENLVTMYAFSCLYSDRLDRLSVPLLLLGKSPQSRRNRAYLSLILAQKNLLVAALFDGLQLQGINFPTTDHIISRVFDLYFKKRYKKLDNRYIMEDGEGKYRLYTKKVGEERWLFIEEIRDGKKFIHRYK
ncbi:MAG: hypothetical protein GXO19_02215 [Epsilonproteobacteria bacterium]|nr:hypothetical protein [Campylobacterota bacterium]NPA56532.1 hypothetical protein [Campylobacterota bacterium]